MKLRKALEKAKQQRGERVAPAAESTPQFNMGDQKDIAEGGWQPPVYTDSARIELDSQAVVKNRCVCIEADAPQLDCYKVLRTKIQQLTQSKGWNTVLITSPRAREGKTLTAINLALTFSKAYNQTILLVDCDLRQQNIHKTLGFQSEAGLIDYLVDDRPLKEVMIWPGIDKLTLISGGRTIDNSTELLGSPRMKELVQEIKSRYDDRYVLFDVPPVLGSADTLALIPYIDSIVMVVEEGQTSTREVQRAVEMLPPEKFIGFVINRQKAGQSAEGAYCNVG
jgi:non-specific protein-tyrosine kinase